MGQWHCKRMCFAGRSRVVGSQILFGRKPHIRKFMQIALKLLVGPLIAKIKCNFGVNELLQIH